MSALARTILSDTTRSVPLKTAMSEPFSEKNFNSNAYSDHRPSYGKALFDHLLQYHQGDLKTAIDLGCGTGQITSELAKSVDRVIGFDTSSTMLAKASKADNIMYQVGEAENLPTIEDNSIDLVTVGQAAHWFNHPAWFREMHRILRSSGTLSFWSYNEAVFTDSPEATAISSRYSHASDGLGPCWPQPGRSILENAMDGVDPPDSLFTNIQRHYTMQRGSSTPSPVSKRVKLATIDAYFRTSSAYHIWQGKNKSPDVIDQMMGEIMEVTGWTKESIVNVHWPTVAVLARKRI